MSHFTLVRDLKPEEIRILAAIEISMRRFEWIPFSNIVFYTKYDPKAVQYWLDKIHKKGLVMRRSKRQAYVLNSRGYDLLALHALARDNVIESIGNSLGVGKEADVYQGISPDGGKIALKFHRIGRTSFRAVKLKRDYIANRHHYSWLYASRLSATKEAEYLKLLNSINADVPKFIAHQRHVVVLKLYQAQELKEFPVLEAPRAIFQRIVKNIDLIYHDAGLVHGDLGEYNVLYSIDGEIYIIDWPQAVKIDHPNALMFLYRDIVNVCNFFNKRHGLNADPDAIFQEITGLASKDYFI
ncbi:MAG: RIO1 family regulatory kinase/ATPase domain-containing protein [Promethearchaeota archaeon]